MKRRIALVLMLGLIVSMFAGCGGSENKIVVGSKNFTENIILGEIMAQLIEAKTNLQVERKLNMGGTLVNFNALKKGDIDLYPDYTGTGLVAILKKEVINDPETVYNIVQEEYNKQFELKWLKPFGLNNTYAIAVPRKLAEERGLQKISDLKGKEGDLILGAEQEFFNRPDGYSGLVETYGLNFKDTKAMDTGLKYQAAGNGDVQVIDAFATDGQLIKYDMVILQDDRQFFPPYYAAPVIRMDTLEKYPELEEVLNQLGGKISDEEMQQLNYQVEVEGKDYEAVAHDFLVKEGLISD
ncbi:glycine betaine ABC transporter substrate-binding protein [Calderihabitans maritimus]|uniref:glycine betaine ABC transporter substrate-binding protein n=1 Tax=Calderihabitans maritimus TaxID=1246530 RepID=UPI00192CFB3E